MYKQQQYISDLHDDFNRAVAAYLSMIAAVERHPKVTDADKQALEQYKQMLKGKEVHEIENSLSDKDVIKALDKIAEFYKDLSDYALEHINESTLWKQLVKQATHQQIENNKNLAKMRFEF